MVPLEVQGMSNLLPLFNHSDAFLFLFRIGFLGKHSTGNIVRPPSLNNTVLYQATHSSIVMYSCQDVPERCIVGALVVWTVLNWIKA